MRTDVARYDRKTVVHWCASLARLSWILGASAGLSLSTAQSRAAEIVVVRPPPHALPVLAPPPRRGWIWAPPHWRWTGAAYVPVAGHWIVARPGMTYVSAHWRATPRGWIFVPAHWRAIP
jgi:hypothetical protein